MLVVGNRFDPATPYHGAVTVDRLLPRSRLLTLAGWGHTSLFASACIDAHVNTYLLTTRVPPKGTVCEPDVVPFAEPAATAQALQAAGASSKAALIPPHAPAAAGRLSDHPATLSLTGRRLTTCLAS